VRRDSSSKQWDISLLCEGFVKWLMKEIGTSRGAAQVRQH
jgi:hypothetical protein